MLQYFENLNRINMEFNYEISTKIKEEKFNDHFTRRLVTKGKLNSSKVENESDLTLLKGFWAKNIVQNKYV